MNWYFSATDSHVELPVSSRLLLGEGLFETMRFADRSVFASYLHWQRIKNSAKYFAIPFAVTFDDWQAVLLKAIIASGQKEGGLRLIVINGGAKRGLHEQSDHAIGLIQTFPCQSDDQPVRLIQAPWQRDERNPVYQHKTINYLEAIQARQYARTQQAHDCFFTNREGLVTETGTANLFALKGQHLYTPPLATGVLPGIARRLIGDYAGELGLQVMEKPLCLEDMQTAEAVFLSNALQYIRPVAAFAGQSMPLRNPVLARLLSALEAAAPFDHYGSNKQT